MRNYKWSKKLLKVKSVPYFGRRSFHHAISPIFSCFRMKKNSSQVQKKTIALKSKLYPTNWLTNKKSIPNSFTTFSQLITKVYYNSLILILLFSIIYVVRVKFCYIICEFLKNCIFDFYYLGISAVNWSKFLFLQALIKRYWCEFSHGIFVKVFNILFFIFLKELMMHKWCIQKQ